MEKEDSSKCSFKKKKACGYIHVRKMHFTKESLLKRITRWQKVQLQRKITILLMYKMAQNTEHRYKYFNKKFFKEEMKEKASRKRFTFTEWGARLTEGIVPHLRRPASGQQYHRGRAGCSGSSGRAGCSFTNTAPPIPPARPRHKKSLNSGKMALRNHEGCHLLHQ